MRDTSKASQDQIRSREPAYLLRTKNSLRDALNAEDLLKLWAQR